MAKIIPQRSPDSILSSMAKFINSRPVGSTFRTYELHDWTVGRTEVKGRYLTMLKICGIMENVKHGHWKVHFHIPDWFTQTHLEWCARNKKVHKYNNGAWVSKPICSIPREVLLNHLKAGTNPWTSAYENPKRATPIAKVNPVTSDKDEAIQELQERLISLASEHKAAAQIIQNSTYGAFAVEAPVATAEKIKPEDSTFFKNPEAGKAKNQLDQNLRENIGLLKAATLIIDNVDILDPVVNGRVINIFEQLKALTQTIETRIEYNRIINKI